MSESAELYNARLVFDLDRQPNLKADLGCFDAFIRSVLTHGAPHPYSLSRAQCSALAARCPSYQCGCVGPLAGAVASSYIYRLTTIAGVMDQNVRNLDVHPDELHNSFFAEYDANKRWIRIDRLIRDQFRGWRGFTFWTDMEFTSEGLLREAYRAGITRDRIQGKCIVLRCPASELRMQIPTILDGYDFAPFCAVSHAGHDGCGRAVDLTDTENLRLGAAEFVVGGLPVNQISFKPIRAVLPVDLSHRLDEGLPLWGQLRDFLLAFQGE